MPTKLADAPPGEIGDPGPDIADLELDRIATWSCYQEVRRTTEALCAPLEIEDYVIQSMPDASPAKWHLAHTSWFFETFVLASVQPGFEPVDSEYSYLFNSYYNAVGERIARPARRALTADGSRGVSLPCCCRQADERITRSGRQHGVRASPEHDHPGVAPRATAPGVDPHRHQARAGEQSQAPGVSRTSDRDRGICRARSAGLDSVCGQPEVDRP